MKNARPDTVTGSVLLVILGFHLTESPLEAILAVTFVTSALPLVSSTAVFLAVSSSSLLLGRPALGLVLQRTETPTRSVLAHSPVRVTLTLGLALLTTDVMTSAAVSNVSLEAGAVLSHPARVTLTSSTLAVPVAGTLLAVPWLCLASLPLILAPATSLLALTQQPLVIRTLARPAPVPRCRVLLIAYLVVLSGVLAQVTVTLAHRLWQRKIWYIKHPVCTMVPWYHITKHIILPTFIFRLLSVCPYTLATIFRFSF